MAGAPFFELFQAALLNAITVVQPVVTNVVDELGNPLTVPMRAAGTELRGKYPAIYVAAQPGRISPLGKSFAVSWDDDAQVYDCAAMAWESKLVFTVEALRPAACSFIVDQLLAGIMSDYSIGSDGSIEEQSIQQSLASVGILFHGRFDSVTYPKTDASQPRVEGQPFEATLSMQCDVQLYWVRPPVTSQGFVYSPSIVLPSGATQAEPPITW